MIKQILYFLFFAFCISMLSSSASAGEAPKAFTVVLDAGHGGSEPGAIGAYAKEKNINLNVVLELGRLIEANCSDVKVIYTRKTDIAVSLDERANIANRAKADVFISVHTNALGGGKIAYGAETYTLGMARVAANLDVAKRENSVILVESNYKERYAGFNPRSSESYIIFEFMQDQYMKQSVSLATMIQKQYVSEAKRKDKGVHQAGFLVLRNTSMPSVLTELGFISTPEEERYLSSSEGVRKMAFAIFKGFLNYKRTQDGIPPVIVKYEEPQQSVASGVNDFNKRKEEPSAEKPLEVVPVELSNSNRSEDVAEAKKPIVKKQEENKVEIAEISQKNSLVKEEKNVDTTNKPLFKIQILVAGKKISNNSPRFKGVTPIDYYEEAGLIKYTYGESANYNEILQTKKSIIKNFPDAFVVAFMNGKKMELRAAISESGKK